MGVFGFLIDGFGVGTWGLVIGVLGLLGWIVLTLLSVGSLTAMNRAIAETLGIEKYGFFAGPPSRPERYRRWCAEHHVEPYRFPDAEPPDVRTRWF